MDDEEVIDRILRRTRRIAVVGLSADPDRPSHGVAEALLARGYEIIPVNPRLSEVLGERAYPDLASVPGRIDLVDVFRRRLHAPELVVAAARRGAPAVWLQSGIVSPEAADAARAAGLDLVMDRCLAVEVALRGLTAPAA